MAGLIGRSKSIERLSRKSRWKGGEANITWQNKMQAFSSTLNRWKEDLRSCVEDSSAHG